MKCEPGPLNGQKGGVPKNYSEKIGEGGVKDFFACQNRCMRPTPVSPPLNILWPF